MLDDIATRDDKKFWDWARRRLYIHFPHNEAITNAIEASKLVPKHQRRNAYIRAYNLTITDALKIHGFSYGKYLEREKAKKRRR